jgi:microcompartment protein CcmK/EutM
VNPFGDFIILTTKKKKIKPEGKKKKKTRPTANKTQPWVSVASGSAARWVGREVSQKSDRKEKKKKTRPTAGETQPWVSVASGSTARWVSREVSQSDDEILPERPSRDPATTRSFLLPSSFLFFLFSFFLHREVSSSAVLVSCGRA